MIELNDENKEFKIKLIDFQSFKIGDTSNYGTYKSGGIVYQIKKPLIKRYYNFGLRSSIICDNINELNLTDKKKTGRVELLYLIYYIIVNFYSKNDYKLPELNNMEQVKEICEKVKKQYDEIKQSNNPNFKNIQEYDERVVLNVVRWCAANLQPVCGFFGGIIAQEIIKATGKYLPIDQWFIQDFLEIAENVKEDADRSLKNCRYDDQIAIFGNEIQDKIKKSNIFMIGAGAIGCELSKNFAMMGFCTDNNSKYTLTDNDHIEISNLTRQFLFRKKDVGKSKALVAIKSIQEMNPEFNGEGLQLKVCPETENIFNENFWDKQDVIIFAVDSVETIYLDGKIILHGKPAIDSGTRGTEARSMVIIPKETLTYKDRIPIKNEIQIPNCTLRNFPLSFQHCIEWSKDKFYYYFDDNINKVKLFFSDYNSFKQKILKVGSPKFKLEQLQEIKILIDMVISKDLKKICTYAIEEFTYNFEHRIQQIIYNYPKDYKDSKGANFWNSLRRFPNPIKFNPNDDLSLEYICKFIFILSHALNIDIDKSQLNKKNIKQISSEIQIPAFIKKYETIDTGDEEEDKKEKINQQKKEKENTNNKENQKKAQIELDNLIKELDSIQKEKLTPEKINPEEFEKDHDENGHIDFIHAGALLRARNYKLDEYDRNKTKEIAGKIIPTILTTTASISGLASMQLYTLLQTSERKYFRNGYIKLNSNRYIFSEPRPPIKNIDKEFDKYLSKSLKYIPEKWCSWDIIKLTYPMNLNQFREKLKKEYNVELDDIIFDEKYICDLTQINNELKIEEAYEKVVKKKINEEKMFLVFQALIKDLPEVKINDKLCKDVAVVIPPFKYNLK